MNMIFIVIVVLSFGGGSFANAQTCPPGNPKTQAQLLTEFQTCASRGLPEGCIKPQSIQDIICSGSTLVSDLPLTPGPIKSFGTTDSSWSPFGTPQGIFSAHGNNNALLGYALNDLTTPTLSFPTGTSGYGKEASNGNQVFGLYGLGELWASGGGVALGAEFTARNYSGHNPDTNLPPNVAIGTPTSVTTGENVTCGTETSTKDCSIGIYVANESGNASDPVFNTGLYMSLYRQFGLFIDAMPSGNQTTAVLQNNGTGIALELHTTGSPVPNNTVLEVIDQAMSPHFDVRQNGDVYFGGKIEAIVAARPTLTSCGSSPSVNRSNDQAGIISVGSGTVTSCQVLFASAFQQIPSCVVSGEGSMPALVITSKTVTSLSVSAAANMAGMNFDYHCLDQP